MLHALPPVAPDAPPHLISLDLALLAGVVQLMALLPTMDYDSCVVLFRP